MKHLLLLLLLFDTRYRSYVQQINGNQPGDPQKAAKLLIQVSEAENPPVHLLLGADAYQRAEQKQQLCSSDRRRPRGLWRY